MNSNFVNANDNNLYRIGVNPNLMGMNTQFSNMNTNVNNNNLLTEQTFQKYDVIPNPGLKSSYINKPYKLVLFKNVTSNNASEKEFILNEPLKDVVSVKLINCLVHASSNTSTFSFLLLKIDELKKNKSITNGGEFNDSFACIDYDTSISGDIYKNNGTYEDIKYFDPPLNSLSKLTYSLYGNGDTQIQGNPAGTNDTAEGDFIIKLELLVETKEKLRVY
tara:strand:+ start:10557 stop:11216 length:660 start_codon:yes stop_codon:yes gene_type:complete